MGKHLLSGFLQVEFHVQLLLAHFNGMQKNFRITKPESNSSLYFMKSTLH